MTTNNQFLDSEAVGRLTGIYRGRKGVTRFKLQAEYLRSRGIPFIPNARGEPIVSWAVINGIETRAETQYTPRALQNSA